MEKLDGDVLDPLLDLAVRKSSVYERPNKVFWNIYGMAEMVAGRGRTDIVFISEHFDYFKMISEIFGSGWFEAFRTLEEVYNDAMNDSRSPLSSHMENPYRGRDPLSIILHRVDTHRSDTGVTVTIDGLRRIAREVMIEPPHLSRKMGYKKKYY